MRIYAAHVISASAEPRLGRQTGPEQHGDADPSAMHVQTYEHTHNVRFSKPVSCAAGALVPNSTSMRNKAPCSAPALRNARLTLRAHGLHTSLEVSDSRCVLYLDHPSHERRHIATTCLLRALSWQPIKNFAGVDLGRLVTHHPCDSMLAK